MSEQRCAFIISIYSNKNAVPKKYREKAVH